MLYIAFCVPQIGVGGPKYFSVPKIGFVVKKNIRRKMNTYSFLTVGVPTITIITIITTTAVFPRGSKKRKSNMEDEALTGRS